MVLPLHVAPFRCDSVIYWHSGTWNTCHDFVTAVTRGQACAICSCDTPGQLNIIKHMNEHAAGEAHQISSLPPAFPDLCLQSSRWELVTDIRTQVCERCRVLKWAAGPVPGGLDKHLDCYLNLIWIWMRLVFAGISWMLTLRINLSFIEFALRLLPALKRGAARSERVQPSPPLWL